MNPFSTIEAGGKSGRLVTVGLVDDLVGELGDVDGLVGGADCADTHTGIPQTNNNATKFFLFAMCFIVNVSQQIVTVRLIPGRLTLPSLCSIANR